MMLKRRLRTTPAVTRKGGRFSGRLQSRYPVWRDAMSLVFEWNPRKAQANLLKHRVSFAEATSV